VPAVAAAEGRARAESEAEKPQAAQDFAAAVLWPRRL
jgi:hypothetical protein